jgi:hypothetical protein
MKTPKQADTKPLFKQMPRKVREAWDAAHAALREKARAEWAAKNKPQ